MVIETSSSEDFRKIHDILPYHLKSLPYKRFDVLHVILYTQNILRLYHYILFKMKLR